MDRSTGEAAAAEVVTAAATEVTAAAAEMASASEVASAPTAKVTAAGMAAAAHVSAASSTAAVAMDENDVSAAGQFVRGENRRGTDRSRRPRQEKTPKCSAEEHDCPLLQQPVNRPEIFDNNRMWLSPAASNRNSEIRLS
jgi:hypothetical protein